MKTDGSKLKKLVIEDQKICDWKNFWSKFLSTKVDALKKITKKEPEKLEDSRTHDRRKINWKTCQKIHFIRELQQCFP